jgi:hypothetical protein
MTEVLADFSALSDAMITVIYRRLNIYVRMYVRICLHTSHLEAFSMRSFKAMFV